LAASRTDSCEEGNHSVGNHLPSLSPFPTDCSTQNMR
jgi:hypothetical protein